jgi:hypothetical protein
VKSIEGAGISMSDARIFNLVHGEARRRAAAYIVGDAPEGWRVTVKPQAKKRAQEERYHAMVADIAKQTTYAGKQWDADDTKRILIDEFADEMRLAGTPLHHDGRLIPSENGRRVIQLGVQSSKFYVGEASQFIEFLFAYGAARDVKWSNESRKAGEEVAA